MGQGVGGKNKALTRCPSCGGLEGSVNLLCTLNSLRLVHWLLFFLLAFPYVFVTSPVTWSVGASQLQEHSEHNLQPCGQSSKRIAPVRFETIPCMGQNSGLKKSVATKD